MAIDWSLYQREPSGFQQALQGLQAGLQTAGTISAIGAQQRQIQLQEQAAQRQQEFNQAFGAAYQSGDKNAVTNLIGQFPEQFEQIKQIAGFRDEQQNKAYGSLGLQLKGAIDAGDIPAAAQLIAGNAEVLRQAGPGYEPENLLKLLQRDPAALAQRSDMFALTALGPKTYYDVMGAREKNQTTMRGQDLTAETARRGQDIRLAEGAANRQIAAANLNLRQQEVRLKALEAGNANLDRQLARETNDLKKQELQQKLAANAAKSEQAKAELQSTASSAVSTYDRGIQTVDEILGSPGLTSVVGVPGITKFLPGTDAQRTVGLIDTLKSQTFLGEVEKMKGLGALTEAEGAKITSAVGSLNTSMREEDFKRSLGQIRNYFEQGKQRTLKKYGSVLKPSEPAQSATPAALPGGIKFLGFE